MSKNVPDGFRRTTDLDLSVSSVLEFEEVVRTVKPIIERLIAQGVISKYVIRYPEVTDTRNMSGAIKLYRKVSENVKAYVYTGIDISIQDLSYGLILNQDGSKQFSFSRMLADKVCVMYSDERTIIRRSKDIYDIYLFNKIGRGRIDLKLVLYCLYQRSNGWSKFNLYRLSVFEEMLASKDSQKKLQEAIAKLMNDRTKVSESVANTQGISYNSIIGVTVSLLEALRSML